MLITYHQFAIQSLCSLYRTGEKVKAKKFFKIVYMKSKNTYNCSEHPTT